MKFRDLKKVTNFNYDLINIFTDYAYILDNYFKDKKNIEEHQVLYEEYLLLSKNLKKVIRKNGFDKI